jgi:cleavage and polyadenylation specificity factor subunit 1
VKAITNFEVPSSKAALQRFLGMINFYHRFIPGIARHLGPLHAATNIKGQRITWSADCQSAFASAKMALSTATLLVFPDPTAETALTTDASDQAIGAVVEQRKFSGPWRPVCFISKKLSPAQSRYSTFDKELLAIYLGIEKCRPYLEGKPFVIYTDHKPLLAGFSARADRSDRQARQLSYISEFSTDLKHIEGKHNVVADALSRSSVSAIAKSNDLFDHVEMARAQLDAPDIAECRSNTSSGLHLVDVVVAPGISLLCDDSLGIFRPLVPATWHKRVFDMIHGLAHQGPKPTLRAISSRYVWHGFRRDIILWCRTCHNCQTAKITRHVKSPLLPPPVSDRRFADINVDLVGPLPSSNGYTYLFTIIDRFTRWPTAIPTTDATAATCAKALLDGWIANFGVPDSVTSDRGPQFTSELWRELNEIMGITKVNHTTAYHPQANGIVERFHRQFKDVLKARGANANWSQHLWAVLLGIRTVWRAGPDCSSAELVYGTTLKVPGEFVDIKKTDQGPTTAFVTNLKTVMSTVRPVKAEYHGVESNLVPSSLFKTSHVYVRHGAHRTPLQAPYDGPFRVVERNPKFFLLDLNGKEDFVSIDRLKPAHGIVNSTFSAAPPVSLPVSKTASPLKPPTRRTYAQVVATQPTPTLQKTRSGRIVRPPVHFSFAPSSKKTLGEAM